MMFMSDDGVLSTDERRAVEQQAAREGFYEFVEKVMHADALDATEKLVLIATRLYGNRSVRIGWACGLEMDTLQKVRATLMAKDWLASPEG